MQNSALQSIPLPILSTQPLIPEHLKNAVEALETRSVLRFANPSARDAAVTSPLGGMMAWITSTLTMTYYDGSTWRQVGQVVKSLQVSPEDSVNSGGRVTLVGAGSHKSWAHDLHQNTMRFRFDPSGANKTVATLSNTQLILGTSVALVQDGIVQPTIYTSSAAPTAGQGKNGDVWLQW
jgi:hypothetical protein